MTIGKRPSDGNSAPDQNADPLCDVWFVALARDHVRQMTVDQMDEALDAQLIHTDTLIWRAGMEGWSPLRKVAGLGDDGRPNLAWLDDSASFAAPTQVLFAAGGPSPAGTALEAGPVDRASSKPSEGRGAAQPPQSLAPMAVPADSPRWATIPVRLYDDGEVGSARSVHRFRAAYGLLVALVLCAGGVAFSTRDHWLELGLSRLNQRASAPEIEPSRTKGGRDADEPEPVPTFRIEGSDLVRVAPLTGTQPDAAESLDGGTKTEWNGELHAVQTQARSWPGRSGRATRSGTAVGKRARTEPPVSGRVGQEPEATESQYDPLNASLP
jgi:hypothetical protein